MHKVQMIWTRAAQIAVLAAVAVSQSNGAAASSFQLIGSIGEFFPGAGGLGAFTADAAGNLYVADDIEGGEIYELLADSGYAQYKLLYSFKVNAGSPVGAFPNAVTLTRHNVILGTTSGGGANYSGVVYNLGTARRTSPVALHAFPTKPTDGQTPESGLTPGPFNRYYGTTLYGGTGAQGDDDYTGDGVAYLISQSTTDPDYAIVHRFGAAGDGINPTMGNLAVDAQGRLYGETINGGASNLGTVFMLQHLSGGGGWQEQVIYSFQPGTDVSTPAANVVLDAKGNLYGCAQGGTHGQGGIFELTPPVQSGGAWQETVLYNFGDRHNDPVAEFVYMSEDQGAYGCGITLDPKTNLIVGQSWGGGTRNLGTVFTLTPPASGQTSWTESIGHNFADGRGSRHPYEPLAEVGGVYYGGGGDDNEIYAFTP
jgi:hypothetical protein